MTFLPVYVVPPTSTVVGEVSRPSPSITVIPRALSWPCSPLNSRSTTPSLYLLTPPMSTPSSVVRTPNCSPSRAESATSAACSSALVGIQPRCRQVPPTLSFSTRATDFPSVAARRAAAYPPLPPPRITRSYVVPLLSAAFVTGSSVGVWSAGRPRIAARARRHLRTTGIAASGRNRYRDFLPPGCGDRRHLPHEVVRSPAEGRHDAQVGHSRPGAPARVRHQSPGGRGLR